MPPKQRQAPPRYNPIGQQPGLTAPGCSDLEAAINVLASDVNYWAQQINNLQTELAKAYLDCDAERSKGWVGYFWPDCARLEELKANHARVLDTYNKLNARWNQAVIATNDLRCNISACTNTNNSLANPTLGADFTPTNIDDLLNPITTFNINQKQKAEKLNFAFNVLKTFFDLLHRANVRKIPTISFDNGSVFFGEITGVGSINVLFQNDAAFGPGWEQHFATNIPGLCDDPNNPRPDQILTEFKNFVEALRTISNQDSSTDLKNLRETVKKHRKLVGETALQRLNQARECARNFDKLIAQMETAKQDIQNTSNKIDMLKRQITNAFHKAIEFTATGSIQYSPANIPVAPVGGGPYLQLNLSPSEAAQLVTQGHTRDDKVFFAINMGAVRRLLEEKLGKSEPCPESGPPPVDPPPGEPEPRGVWWKYPIKAIITVTPKFKQDPLAPNNAFIMALRGMSVGPDYKLERKDSANTTLSCDNIPVFKTNKTPAGHISIFGKPNNLNIEAITNAPLNPISLESCEGTIP